MKSFITILCLFFLTALPAFCADFYVSTAGSDGNPGTQAQPFATIQHAIDACPYGVTSSTVHLDGSTWNESPVLTATAYFMGQPPDRRHLTCIGDYNGPNGMGGRNTTHVNGCFTLNAINSGSIGVGQSANAKLQSIHVMSVIAYPQQASPPMPNDPGVNIIDCDIEGSTSHGIICNNDTYMPAISITNCTVSNCQQEGIHVSSGDFNPYVTNCTITNNQSIGVHFMASDAPFPFVELTFQGNIVSNNGSYGFYIEGSNAKLNLSDNQIINNSDCGIYLTGSNCCPDFGGGALSSPGNNTISGNGTYEVYNDSPNNIYAKYNHWDDQSEGEMAGHFYDNFNVTRIWDHWENSSKGYIVWSDPGPLKVAPSSVGQIKATFIPSTNNIKQAKAR